VLAPFDERHEILTADQPDAENEIDIVQDALLQTGQIVKNSPKVNGDAQIGTN
jgi:hypothetical protein